MAERRVLIVGAGAIAARIAAVLTTRDIQAQVLMVDDSPPEPRNLVANMPTLGLRGRYESSDTSPAVSRERRRAQWKQEIQGRKKP